MDEQILIQAANAFKATGSMRKAAKILKVANSTAQERIRKAAEAGLLGTKPVLPGFRISKTTAVTNQDGDIVREFIQQRPDVGEKFQMPAAQILKGVSALVDADGRVTQQWIKTKTDDVLPALTEALEHVFTKHRGKSILMPAPRQIAGELLTIYPIADQHLGLLSWGKETGEPYDLKIGVKRLRETAARLIANSPPSKTAVVLNLGDWYHADDQRNATPASGHQLDVDGRYFKVMVAGVDLMKYVIDLAKQRHKFVVVRSLPGNHDPHAAMALTIALASFYANDPRVTVEMDPSDYFWHRFGSTLIGATHGHKMKPDRMAMTMATARRKDWGATKHHVFYFGHIHHETAREVGDCRVESFRTITGKDAYAHSGGYLAGQSLVSITHHIRDGEIHRQRVNLPPPEFRGRKSY